MGSVSRLLTLDAQAPADVAGFRSLQTAVSVVRELPPEAWRIVGGWMVRAWIETTGAGIFGRTTVDADLELMPVRAVGRARQVPDRLREEGMEPFEEPFRFTRKDGSRIDLLVAPGSSRHHPPRLGNQVVFEVEGSCLAFRLPPEPVRVRCDGEECTIQIPRLAGALAIKVILIASGRPLRARDDARDVAGLLRAARREPETLLSDLRAHKRMSDVKRTLRTLSETLRDEDARVAEWISQELGPRSALTAVADTRWLLTELG